MAKYLDQNGLKYYTQKIKNGTIVAGKCLASGIQGVIDISHIPQGALERVVQVADDTARKKLTAAQAQLGDTVKVLSTGRMYIVVDESKLSTDAGYMEYTAGQAAQVPWSGVTGKPATLGGYGITDAAPKSHTHSIDNVTGLADIINGAEHVMDISMIDSLRAPDFRTDQSPTLYTLVKKNNDTNTRVGVILYLSDDMGHSVTQILFTHYMLVNGENTGCNCDLVDGDLDTTMHDHHTHIYSRSFGISQAPRLEVGKWTKWEVIGGYDVAQIAKKWWDWEETATEQIQEAYAFATTSHHQTSGFRKLTTDSHGMVTGSAAVTKDDITALGIPGSIPAATNDSALSNSDIDTAVAQATA